MSPLRDLLLRLWAAAPSATTLALGALIGAALLAMAVPLAVLVWWSGWRLPLGPARRAPAVPAPPHPDAPEAERYLVYLSGMGDISGEYSTRYEDALLEAVAARVPGLAVITDVFAFSVTNEAMTDQWLLGWFWRWTNEQRLRKGPLKAAGRLIFARNILHIAVSADYRYGPIYNYGTAEMILQGLLRKGYRLGSGTPITLLGYSGGGQIALASSGYLAATLGAPVQVISLAGVMNSNRSLDYIERLYHLYGSKDGLQRLGALIFPSRWPWPRTTRWNRALTAGRIRLVCTGPMTHAGRGSYLDATRFLPDGTSYMEHTADLIAAEVRGIQPRTL
jgi:hypothetical protein